MVQQTIYINRQKGGWMKEREEEKEGSREQIGQSTFSESRLFFKLFYKATLRRYKVFQSKNLKRKIIQKNIWQNVDTI